MRISQGLDGLTVSCSAKTSVEWSLAEVACMPRSHDGLRGKEDLHTADRIVHRLVVGAGVDTVRSGGVGTVRPGEVGTVRSAAVDIVVVNPIDFKLH